MSAENTTKIFEENASPPALMNAAQYYLLLEKLLAHGQGYGKTEPVAAFLLRDLKVVNANDGKEDNIRVESRYLVMDPTVWPNEYGRQLLMKEIAVKWAMNTVEEKEINTPDYMGPGVWTSKQSGFEFDYVRRDEQVEVINGKVRRTTLHDPNPEAYRICLITDKPITIPVPWGDYHIGTGGTLAVREQDVKELSDALKAIREQKLSIEEALYIKKDDGSLVSRFDVYGMEPGFLEENYAPVLLKDKTNEIQNHFAASITRGPSI